MTGRLRELADRPLGDVERHGLLVLAVGAIVCAAALLLSTPAERSPQPRPKPALAAAAPAAGRPAGGTPPQHGPAAVEATARRFLRGYLRYIYGRGPAKAISAATAGLRTRLAGTRLRVPPAAKRRHPRVIETEVVRLGKGSFAVTAGVADGGPAHYTIELTVIGQEGRWRVAEVADY